MIRLLNLFIALIALLVLSACDRQSSTSSTGSAAAPPSITTQSGVEMISLPAGEFVMGNDHGNADESPAHKVKVSPFLIDKFEVTQEMFAKAQLPNPSHWQDPKKPVERVRWRDAKQYCNERSLLEGLKPCYNEKTVDWDCDFTANGYRLPTEAEWEYAARYGAPDAQTPPEQLRQSAWFAENAGEKTHAVGQKKPNAAGIFDMDGNVSEWCEDVYKPDYYKQSPTQDPTGPASPEKDVLRVMRGGNWKSSADMCRPTVRQGQRTGNTDACFYTDFCGFRCVRRASPDELAQLQKGKK